MQQILVGIDGGGTKTEAWATTVAGEVIGTGISGPTNLTSTSVGAAAFNLREAIRQATETIRDGFEIPVMIMGLAGMDTPVEAQLAHKTFVEALAEYRVEELIVQNDSRIALVNGTRDENALVIISGTGSIGYGRNSSGAEITVGGMDFLASDQGSGYDIGRHVLQAAVLSYDGRMPPSLLEKLVAQAFDLTGVQNLKSAIYNPTLTKIEVAELAQLCVRACEEGDPAANAILARAAEDLFVHVEALVRRLEFQSGAFAAVLSGSVAQSPAIVSILTERIQAAYQVSPLVPTTPPVRGAITIAQQLVKN